MESEPPLSRASAACLTDEQLTELVDGLASEEDKALFERHVGECATCAGLVAAVSAARTNAPGVLGAAVFDDLPRGTRIGRYEILERLGAGGMGTVYAAHDPALDRRIALKLIRAEVAGPELEARLLREAKAMARLSHPEVIAVHDAGRDGERLFIAMELIDGGTLRQWLEEKPRSWREIVAVYLRAGQGLAQAHASGVIHRDFKPDNVLVGRDGRVRVTDFGLARAAGEGAERDSQRLSPALSPRDRALENTVDASDAARDLALEATADAPLTRTGALVGTPVYMAPEQLIGLPADARSDVYSFCVALFEALYRARPFLARTLLDQLLEKEANEIHEPPSERDVPVRVRRVIERGLRAKPAERYASMPELLTALERAARLLIARARPVAWGAAALLALGISGGALRQSARSRQVDAAPAAADSIHIAAAALAGAEGRLACPIFETHGVADVGVRLGAAAAMLACMRESWALGGRDDRILTPAALLDVPTQPVDDFTDPYVDPAQRGRTIAIAKRRAAAYLDGTITREGDTWTVEIAVRAPDEREISRAKGSDGTFLTAVRLATLGLWSPPLVRRAIDPEVARWTSLTDDASGLLQADLALFADTSACESLSVRASELGASASYLQKLCEVYGAPLRGDASGLLPPRVVESSPEGLVTSLQAVDLWGVQLPADESARLALQLGRLREAESSSLGRAYLALEEGTRWVQANQRDRARTPLLFALHEDPLLGEAWGPVVRPNGAMLSRPAAAVASAWFPAETTFMGAASSWRGDELPARIRDTRLAFVLDPRPRETMFLGRALAEAGRADDARSIAATPFGAKEQGEAVEPYVLSFIDFHQARLQRALARLFDSGDGTFADLVVGADVAGRSTEIATKWAQRFLSLPDAKAGPTARNSHSPMVLCMRARADLASRCLDRVESLGRTARNWWYDDGTAMLAGARRYARGDMRGAVARWRSLVVESNVEIVRILPTDAFERAGEPDLAARLDAQKMPFTFIAGVSDAAPREARRAFAAGDRKRAETLARSVIQAWEVADMDVPEVNRMRALLRQLAR